MAQHRFLFLLLALFVAVTSAADCGRLIGRRPNTVSPLYNVTLSSVKTTISITNLLAVVHVDEEFTNTDTLDMEGYYVFQLPEGALVDGMWLWIDGERWKFIVKDKEEAQHIYDSLSHQGVGDPAILQTLGANRFQLKITPIKAGATRRIEIRYFHTVPMNYEGLADFYYPLSHASYQQDPVHNVDINIDVRSDYAIRNLATNYDSIAMMTTTQKIDDGHYSIAFGTEDMTYEQDLHITFEPEGWQQAMPWMDYAYPDTIADGYFMMWCPMTSPAQEAVPTDFIIAIDASGSMTGLRSQTTIDAVANILARLQPFDRFRLVQFSDAAQSFPADTAMMFATDQNVTAALSYLSTNYSAEGMTNYRSAFTEGTLMTNFRSAAVRRFLMVTDGLPNVDGRTTAELTNYISQVQFLPVTIFTEKLNLLDSLAKDHAGFLTTIEQGDDIANIISRLAFQFNSGQFTDIEITPPANTSFVLPDTLPAISYGNDIIIAGRFSDAGPVRFDLAYSSDGYPLTKTQPVDMQHRQVYPEQIAKYWGALRIQQYLRELRNSPNNEELIESVIRLSEFFNILSPYTAFIAWKIDDPSGTPVEDIAVGTIPSQCHLFQNYPNPFNPTTTISWHVPDASFASQSLRILVYDASGKLIRTLYDGNAEPGLHTIVWDGTDEAGNAMPSGVYLCRMQVGDTVQSVRMILVK